MIHASCNLDCTLNFNVPQNGRVIPLMTHKKALLPGGLFQLPKTVYFGVAGLVLFLELPVEELTEPLAAALSLLAEELVVVFAR